MTKKITTEKKLQEYNELKTLVKEVLVRRSFLSYRHINSKFPANNKNMIKYINRK